MEVRRLATSVATWRYGALEARWKCSDVEAWSSELWRYAADLGTWRFGEALQVCRRGGMKVLAEEQPAHRGPK